LEDEAEAIEQAKKRLERNICLGVNRKTYGIAGKLADIDSQIGLPGLEVKVALGKTAEETYLDSDTTDSYGNFCLEMAVKDLKVKANESTVLRFDIFAAEDHIVHTEEVTVKPKGGKIDHQKLLVKCTGKLSESLDYGKLVKESVESDEELVKSRTLNMKDAYTAFGRLTETTLTFIGDLKAEIAVNPPKITPLAKVAAPAAAKKTRYMGNSSTRELHDLSNEQENCRIAQIRFDHRVNFRTQKEALNAGYDFCAYCFGRDKSKR
jgi:hypothetical protein